jgi:protein MpaA
MQRLGKNHGAYHGETINIREILRDVEHVARSYGWQPEVFHASDGFQWFALHRKPTLASSQTFRVYLSTGIHGDEPAGPLAALRLIRDNQWPAQAEIILLPCLNPIGFANNKRENAEGIDLNRDYLQPQSPEIRAHVAWLEKQAGFDLSLCLHEDWESHGFYLYELNPDHKPSRAEGMIAAVAPVCLIDHSEIIEGREAHGGIIRPSLDPRTRPLWPEAFWLLQHKTRLSYTLEAPSDFPLEVRVKALVTAVKTALA